MRQASLVEFMGREVSVRELTVTQIINLLKNSDSAEPLGIDLLLDLPGCGDMLRESTGLTADELGEGTPAQLAGLLAEVKRVNPHWAGAVNRLRDEMERIRSFLPGVSSGPAAGL